MTDAKAELVILAKGKEHQRRSEGSVRPLSLGAVAADEGPRSGQKNFDVQPE